MNLERYDTLVTEDVLTFSFTSVGPKGRIQKLVIYQHIEGSLYNLAFGDKQGVATNLNDIIVTDNKDTEKVLATVAATLFDFFATHTGTVVLAQGSTHSRTRLYRRYLTQFLDFINQEFLLYGELDGKLERFKRDRDYKAFFIAKK